MNTQDVETMIDLKIKINNARMGFSLFFATISGALLGVLSTLLILALINHGTLRFASYQSMDKVIENVDLIIKIIQSIQGVLIQ